MTVEFGVVVAMMAMSLDVGAALPLQFEPVNQSVEVPPVHVSSAFACDIGSPAMAVPASSNAASLAERCIGRSFAQHVIMTGDFQKDFRERAHRSRP
jgi:hypothetical protein